MVAIVVTFDELAQLGDVKYARNAHALLECVAARECWVAWSFCRCRLLARPPHSDQKHEDRSGPRVKPTSIGQREFHQHHRAREERRRRAAQLRQESARTLGERDRLKLKLKIPETESSSGNSNLQVSLFASCWLRALSLAMPKRSRDEDDVVKVSEDPLILVFPAFVDEQQCATLLSLARQADIGGYGAVRDGPLLVARTAAEQRLLDEVEERLGAITGCAPHADEAVLNHMRQPRGPPPPPGHEHWHRPFVAKRFPSGIHVDTNGGLARRHASALLYLSTPGAGGQAVFPFAAMWKTRPVWLASQNTSAYIGRGGPKLTEAG